MEYKEMVEYVKRQGEITPFLDDYLAQDAITINKMKLPSATSVATEEEELDVLN